MVMSRGTGLAGVRVFAVGRVSPGRGLGRDMDVKRVVVRVEGAAGGGDRRPVERMGDSMPGLRRAKEARHRQQGGAKAHAEGAKQSGQSELLLPAIRCVAACGNGQVDAALHGAEGRAAAVVTV